MSLTVHPNHSYIFQFGVKNCVEKEIHNTFTFEAGTVWLFALELVYVLPDLCRLPSLPMASWVEIEGNPFFPGGVPTPIYRTATLEYWAGKSAMSTQNLSNVCQKNQDIGPKGPHNLREGILRKAFQQKNHEAMDIFHTGGGSTQFHSWSPLYWFLNALFNDKTTNFR